MVEVGGVEIKRDPLMADIMAYLGFDPYDGPLGSGWFRWIKMTKSSMFGEIGSYYLHDYILVEYLSVDDVISKLGPVSDVMTQRVALVGEDWWKKPIVKNFWFGLKGWAEVAMIAPHPDGARAPKKFKDLSQVLHVAITAYSKAVADGIKNT
jgi:hypothetical protein